jgi:hypothetical protein
MPMSHELEAVAGESLSALSTPAPHGHVPAFGAPCANCATPLQGPWCHACGQSAEDFHRSIFRLAAEVVEGLLHFDGRLWRTLPGLLFRPGRLTRDYLEGHRAPQIPPLRLFLVILLAIFLVGGLVSSGKTGRIDTTAAADKSGKTVTTTTARSFSDLTPEERAQIRTAVGKVKVSIASDKPNEAATTWLQKRLTKTLDDPERFQLILEQWSERFAFLMLPISTLMLAILFIFQRRFYLFDHTIFSLHSLSAMGVMLITAMLLNVVVGDWAYLMFFPVPLHLFAHMRGVYQTSIVGALIRMALLFVGASFAVGLLIVGLIAVGLNGMGD